MTSEFQRSLVGAAVAAILSIAPVTARAVNFDYAINFAGGPGPYAGAGITCYDNDTCDLNPMLNQMAIVSGAGGLPTIAGFTGSIESSITNSPGGPVNSILNLTWNLDATGNTGGAIVITSSAVGFTFPATGLLAHQTSSIGGTTADASVTGEQWINLSNTLFATSGVSPGTQGPFSSVLQSSFNNTATAGFTSVIPFSITDRVYFTVDAGGRTNGSIQSVVSIPEPASMLLLGAGLLGFGAFARRHKAATV